jgi:hypothetical protein
VIDDLYRPNAAFRDHERRIDLIAHQIEHAMTLAVEYYVTGQSAAARPKRTSRLTHERT